MPDRDLPPIDGNEAMYERLSVKVFPYAAEASRAVAGKIAELIRRKQAAGQNCVLGLATGSTPIGVYRELIRLHQAEALSLANVITFNLDEYFPMPPEAPQSYRRFMQENLFNHVDIPPGNIHIPDGTLPLDQVAQYCRDYEQAIHDAGGLDLQILGIGRTGHIGFNEPGSRLESRTRLITLDRLTRLDAASDFFGQQHVPRRAITMGVATILEARQIILLAFGEAKAPVIAQAVEGPVSTAIAASYLQRHPDVQFILDRAAAAELTRYKCPWLIGPVDWQDPMIRKAVIWLSRQLKKAILKLTDEDYNEHGLQDLVAEHGPAYEINLNVFRMLTQNITGWPGGKPEAARRPGDIRRPTDNIFPKRVLVFSPHPDDDVISMGGTLIRLAEQGHEVHVAYQTSGSIAVFDYDALRFADFAAEFNRLFGLQADAVRRLEQQAEQFIRNKKPAQEDSEQLRAIKALIRQGEARAAARVCQIPMERLHFLTLPFYETGLIRKNPLGPRDIELTVQVLERVKPHQIYAAGDLSDPHGTHRVCLQAVLAALEKVRSTAWFADCEVWLYRGAWQEWEPEDIDMAIPLSPQELLRKRDAIFKHQSQKDRAMFPGSDGREFWQRAEDRNRATAVLYDQLGLAEYEAIEGFVRWTGDTEAGSQRAV